MAPPVDLKVEGMVISLSKLNYSQARIVNEFKKSNVTISKTTVSNTINNKGKNRRFRDEGIPPPPQTRIRKVLTRRVLRKIDALISKENPATQRDISRKLNVPLTSVHRGIKILKKIIWRKYRVHQLTVTHKKTR